jgi:hypothetical protein
MVQQHSLAVTQHPVITSTAETVGRCLIIGLLRQAGADLELIIFMFYELDKRRLAWMQYRDSSAQQISK